MAGQELPLVTQVAEFQDMGEINNGFDDTDFHRPADSNLQAEHRDTANIQGDYFGATEHGNSAVVPVSDPNSRSFATYFDAPDGHVNVEDSSDAPDYAMCCSCCWKYGGNSVDMAAHYTDLPTLQEEKDLSTSSEDSAEVKTYMAQISHCLNTSQKTKVMNELMYVARTGFVNRLKVTLNVIKTCLDSQSANQFLLHDCTGELSETPLHVALIYNQTEAAKILIDHGKANLVMKPYTHCHYEGTTALHFAVVNGNIEAIDKMVSVLNDEQRSELLHTAATGTFFKEKFKASELPLTLSVWCGYNDLFDKLIQYGASPFQTESTTGNNIIHSLVLYSEQNADLAVQMYHFVLNSFKCHYHCKGMREMRGNSNMMPERKGVRFMQQTLLQQSNKDGYTPLALAAKCGFPEMFHSILGTEGVYKFTLWRFGPAKYELYDMTEVDTLKIEGNSSAFELLIYEHKSFESKGSLECLQSPPIKKLIDLKWKNYRAIHYTWAMLHLLYSIIFTLCAVFRPLQQQASNSSSSCASSTTYYTKRSLDSTMSDVQGQLFMAGAIFVVIMAVCYFAFECVDVALSLKLLFGKRNYKPSMAVIFKPDPFRTVSWFSSLFTITWFILHMLRHDSEDTFLSLAVVFTWHFGLFFFKANQSAGFLTVMIWKMLVGDLVLFMEVCIIMLLAYATGMYVVYQEAAEGVPTDMSSFERSLFKFYDLTFGLAEFDDTDKSHSPVIARLLYMFFLALVVLLLLNMLIAAFSATYSNIDQLKGIGWKKLRSEALLLMERRLYGLHGKRMGSGYEIHNIEICGKKTYRWFLPVENLDYHTMSGSSKPEYYDI
ncbi:transient receptor potential cation channel subfamily V member 6 [Lingula anatina]|uniref:Transient receptor potential cation channel subfamily V member 6 n=1 Tax=Lingula anatina TaxID=7574 RepID=A0A1S3IA20_LINAN|nr:transient receptor potential cation channel subfamily V member 6 [Lingula anatina]|eukprot:XP_013394254.1 transient receptor potential cation channel subfamily V member 6 [Lingula anatina]